MEIKITKPDFGSFRNFKLAKFDLAALGQRLKFFSDQESFAARYFPVSWKSLLSKIIVFSILTLAFYLITNFLRVDNEELTEIVKQTTILNYSLWAAYLLFIVGTNLLYLLVFKLLKLAFLPVPYLLNQTYVAVCLYTLMRFVAAMIISLDELLPFEPAVSFKFVSLNLLTVLFLAQILIVIISYNFWKLVRPQELGKKHLLDIILVVVYTAVIWTLISP